MFAEFFTVGIQNLPDQRESVAVQAGRCQTYQFVSLSDAFPVDYFLPVHYADCKTGYVIFIFTVKAGHFSSLTTYERTSRHNASVSHSLYDFSHLLRPVFAYGYIVEEKQRFSSAADDIIDAHCHSVDTYGVVLVHHECDFQLRPYTVSARYQHRFLVFAFVQCKKSAEASYVGKHFGSECAPYIFPHQPYGFVAGFNINPGRFVVYHLKSSSAKFHFLHHVLPDMYKVKGTSSEENRGTCQLCLPRQIVPGTL